MNNTVHIDADPKNIGIAKEEYVSGIIDSDGRRVHLTLEQLAIKHSVLESVIFDIAARDNWAGYRKECLTNRPTSVSNYVDNDNTGPLNDQKNKSDASIAQAHELIIYNARQILRVTARKMVKENQDGSRDLNDDLTPAELHKLSATVLNAVNAVNKTRENEVLIQQSGDFHLQILPAIMQIE